MAEELQLIVTHDLGDYPRGTRVIDPQQIEQLLRDHPTKVVRVVPDQENRAP